MLSLGSKCTLPTTVKNHQLGYHCALVVNAYRWPCEVAWSRANVNTEAEGPSTSYTAPSRCWRRQQLFTKQRQVAVLASPKPEGSCHAPPLDDGKVGVVIVDHGSRKKASNDMLVEFGELYGRVTGQKIVEIAHMEIARPTIEEAISRCAARGARTVVVAPYFLSRGRHIQEDIPALVRKAQQEYPELNCVIAEPIGIDVLMVQLINNRVATALSLPTAAVEVEVASELEKVAEADAEAAQDPFVNATAT
ncbi:hypothetical protein Vretimale_9001 [Volvox reticuliferus]|uniref:Sirohydrochlorin cobaltochelatase n=1 Tax=Volvox reticuliferus TaxID=1737510 RepID=A0A8J4GCK0_9CHLO|nr:hypothetical protein Vretifemale_14460 [Volvox reticuliferus]GIM04412.1 hypothetical protein Vretimale_9001 [Volvox reticuliferus]